MKKKPLSYILRRLERKRMQADNQAVVFSGLRIFYTRHLCYNSVTKFQLIKNAKTVRLGEWR